VGHRTDDEHHAGRGWIGHTRRTVDQPTHLVRMAVALGDKDLTSTGHLDGAVALKQAGLVSLRSNGQWQSLTADIGVGDPLCSRTDVGTEKAQWQPIDMESGAVVVGYRSKNNSELPALTPTAHVMDKPMDIGL
jgi:hypothetical protein